MLHTPNSITQFIVLSVFTLSVCLSVAASQRSQSAESYKIVVIAGEDAVNIIQQKTAVAPVVEVRDRNDLPVAGVPVTFAVSGNSAAFAGGAQTITIATNAAGRAVVSSLTPLSSGAVQINVTAAVQGQTLAATITQTNFLTAAQAAQAGAVAGGASGSGAAGGGSGGGVSGGTIAGVAGAIAGGLVAVNALRDGLQVESITAAPRAVILGTDTLVAFTAEVSAGSDATYGWEFGDGGTSNEVSPRYVFRSAGTFTVRLTVSKGDATVQGQTTVDVRTLDGGWAQFSTGSPNLLLTQSGSTVSGSWFRSGAGSPPCLVSGTLHPTSPRVRLRHPPNQCEYVETLLLLDPSDDANTLTGQMDQIVPESPVPLQPVSFLRR